MRKEAMSRFPASRTPGVSIRLADGDEQRVLVDGIRELAHEVAREGPAQTLVRTDGQEDARRRRAERR